jgi:hypothetical protein
MQTPVMATGPGQLTQRSAVAYPLYVQLTVAYPLYVQLTVADPLTAPLTVDIPFITHSQSHFQARVWFLRLLEPPSKRHLRDTWVTVVINKLAVNFPLTEARYQNTQASLGSSNSFNQIPKTTGWSKRLYPPRDHNTDNTIIRTRLSCLTIWLNVTTWHPTARARGKLDSH